MKNESVLWLLAAGVAVWFFFFRGNGAADHADLNYALETARQEDKLVLAYFTGSDWCGPCIELDKSVLSHPDFRDYARQNLAVVVVDFPRSKALPEDDSSQNQQLKNAFRVAGFPTLVLLDADGRELARRRGYHPDGVSGMQRWVEEARSR
jgi:protein disulfide-isomerase